MRRRHDMLAAMAATEPIGTSDVAERLRISRKPLKLTQARLCSITGISQQAWNNAERGRARIGLDNAILLCQATGLTLDWVFRGIRSGLPFVISEAIRTLEAHQKAAPRHH